jgi:hypothetical protein
LSIDTIILLQILSQNSHILDDSTKPGPKLQMKPRVVARAQAKKKVQKSTETVRENEKERENDKAQPLIPTKYPLKEVSTNDISRDVSHLHLTADVPKFLPQKDIRDVQDLDDVEAFNKAWREQGLEETVGRLEEVDLSRRETFVKDRLFPVREDQVIGD